MPWRLFSRGLTPSGLTLAIFSQVFFFFEAFLRSLVFSFSNFTLSAADEYFNLHNIPENTGVRNRIRSIIRTTYRFYNQRESVLPKSFDKHHEIRINRLHRMHSQSDFDRPNEFENRPFQHSFEMKLIQLQNRNHLHF